MSAPFGTYTAHEGELYRDGMPLNAGVADRLLKAFEADREPYAKALAKELRAAINKAKAYHETEVA